MAKHSVAILFHEAHREKTRYYRVATFAEIWRKEGIEVIELYGTSSFVPADLVFLHVDLSVVPEDYLELASRYPRSINKHVTDIRKSKVSSVRVWRESDHAGRVIVKSDLNYAGAPERAAGAVQPPREHGLVFKSPKDYRIFENVHDIPEGVWSDPDLIVERFVPEMDGEHYVIRSLHFLGSKVHCVHRTSSGPVVNSSTILESTFVEPHPDMVAARERLRFDYGKFDFVIHDGTAILLDTNKTIGAPQAPDSEEFLTAQRERALAIVEYL